MKLIWTKSNLPLSLIIRSLLKEPVSHFGIVFDQGIVFHSNLLGTHIEWYGTFKKHCEIVYEIDFPMTLNEEEQVYKAILDTYDDKSYDFAALFYFAYRAICLRLFKIPLPNKNAWANSNRFLCTELYSVLPIYLIKNSMINQDLSIISPYQLYLDLKKDVD